jgi:hypothetical protein
VEGRRFVFAGIPTATLTVLPGFPFKFGNGGVKLHFVIIPPSGWDAQSFSCNMHEDGKFLDFKWSMPEMPFEKGIIKASGASDEANKAYDNMLECWEEMGYTGKHSMTYMLPTTVIYQKEVEWNESTYGTGSSQSVEENVVRVSRTISGPVKKEKLTPYVAPPAPPNGNGSSASTGSSGSSGN